MWIGAPSDAEVWPRKIVYGFWRGSLQAILAVWGTAFAVTQAPAQQTEVLYVTTQLVVLDATVLDKEGKIVTLALGRDDFQIEENKKPQAIYSFEAVDEHTIAAAMNPFAAAQQINTYLFDSDFGFAGYISATGERG
ncbi:MAG TPA: hypothetical protein VNU92_13845 [Edaphobacter sp.]|jgi:hypothetical protein|nr:hypothetical protein [Edaphobacter sp.]